MRTRAMLVRASQRMHGGESIPALADPLRKLRKRSSISSLQHRPLAWRDAEDDAKHWNMRFTHFLLLQPEAWLVTGYGSTAAWLHRHPFICAFQIGVSIERQFSRIFPAHPRSLARCLSRALRHGASLLRLHRPAGFGFQKILCATNTKEIFQTFRKRRRLALGAGHTRVASRKSVPRVIRANTTKEN
jgi:hypothetical protein